MLSLVLTSDLSVIVLVCFSFLFRLKLSLNLDIDVIQIDLIEDFISFLLSLLVLYSLLLFDLKTQFPQSFQSLLPFEFLSIEVIMGQLHILLLLYLSDSFKGFHRHVLAVDVLQNDQVKLH